MPKTPEPAHQPPCEHDATAAEPPIEALPKGKGCRYWPWRLLKPRSSGKQTIRCPDCDGELHMSRHGKRPTENVLAAFQMRYPEGASSLSSVTYCPSRTAAAESRDSGAN